MTEGGDRERPEPIYVEPEVLPPEGDRDGPPTTGKRLENAFGPIAAGLIIDTIDIATFGPIGFMIGPFIGGIATFWICSIYGMPVWQRLFWALSAGVYCAFPKTEFIPMATMIGACARFVNSKS
jgi:hypothetical protein